MNPGRLKHRLTVMQMTEVKNEYSEPELTESPLFSVWAELLNSDQAQQFIAEGEAIVANKTFRVRFDNRITTKLFIKYNGKTYNIINVDNENEESRFNIISLVNYEL